jgi:hypothetical protein
VQAGHLFDLAPDGLHGEGCQDGAPILAPLPVSDGEPRRVEGDVLDPELHALAQAKPGSVLERAGQAVHASKPR